MIYTFNDLCDLVRFHISYKRFERFVFSIDEDSPHISFFIEFVELDRKENPIIRKSDVITIRFNTIGDTPYECFDRSLIDLDFISKFSSVFMRVFPELECAHYDSIELFYAFLECLESTGTWEIFKKKYLRH